MAANIQTQSVGKTEQGEVSATVMVTIAGEDVALTQTEKAEIVTALRSASDRIIKIVTGKAPSKN